MTKPTKWHVHPAKTQISLGICPVWSESSLSAWRKLGSLATHWVHSEDSDQPGQMPRLIWVFAGCTVIMLVLSWGSSFCQYCQKLEQHVNLCKGVMTFSDMQQKKNYRNVPKFRQVWANSVDPNQTAPDQGLHCFPFRLHLLDALPYEEIHTSPILG